MKAQRAPFPLTRATAPPWTAAPGTNRKSLHCLRAMSTSLVKQFDAFADCCLELARSAETPARRSRLVKMAHEYRQANEILTTAAPNKNGSGQSHEFPSTNAPGASLEQRKAEMRENVSVGLGRLKRQRGRYFLQVARAWDEAAE